MKPIIYQFNPPEWMSFLPETVTIHSYGVMIGLGIIFSYLLAIRLGKSLKVDSDKTASIFFWVFIASVIGGKIFFYFENPEIYFTDPSKMITKPGGGFVFYGSLIFAIPTLIWYLRKSKIPVWDYLDIVAIYGPLLHLFGRMGCFMAGCCHGKACSPAYGIIFSDPDTKANPMNTPVYPTQLYSVILLLGIILFLYFYRNKKKFAGQMFLLYVIIYSIGRGIIEIFRGDEARGYIIDGILSHSQLIAIVMIAITAIVWMKRQKVRN